MGTNGGDKKRDKERKVTPLGPATVVKPAIIGAIALVVVNAVLTFVFD